jgi:hypothetical protein
MGSWKKPVGGGVQASVDHDRDNTAHNLAAPDTPGCPAQHRRTGY